MTSVACNRPAIAFRKEKECQAGLGATVRATDDNAGTPRSDQISALCFCIPLKISFIICIAPVYERVQSIQLGDGGPKVNSAPSSLIYASAPRTSLRACQQYDQTRQFRISVSRTQAQQRYVSSFISPFLLVSFFGGVRKCRNFPKQRVSVPFLKLLVVEFGNVSYHRGGIPVNLQGDLQINTRIDFGHELHLTMHLAISLLMKLTSRCACQDH